MSSAVLLSTVGVAGTIIGAAIGSVVATAGSSIYSHYLERQPGTGSRRPRRWPSSAHERPVRRQRRWADPARARLDADAAGPSRPTTSSTRPRSSWPTPRTSRRALVARGARGLRWKRIAAVAGGIFVVAMLVIVSFELLTGRAVSTYTGGSDSGSRTSIPGLGGRHSTGTPDNDPHADEAPSTGESRPPRPVDADPDTEHARRPATASSSPSPTVRDPDHGPDDDRPASTADHRPDAHRRRPQAPPAG